MENKEDVKSSKNKIIKQYKETIISQQHELKDLFSIKDVSSGEWFSRLVEFIIQKRGKNRTKEYFLSKYQTDDVDNVAKHIVSDSININTAAGFILGGAGGLGGIGTAILTTAPEIILTTYNQLALVHDLSVLYGKPVFTENNTDILPVLINVFALSDDDLHKGGVKIAIDKGGKYLLETGSQKILVGIFEQVCKVIGKRLTRKFAKRMLIKIPPVIGSLFGAGTSAVSNYTSTKAVAQRAIYCYRTEEMLIKTFQAIPSLRPVCHNDRVFTKAREKLFKHTIITLLTGCYHLVSNSSEQPRTQNLIDFITNIYTLEEIDYSKIKEGGKIPLVRFVESWQNLPVRKQKTRVEVAEIFLKIFQLIAASFSSPTTRDKQRIASLAIQMRLNEEQALIGFDQCYHKTHDLL